MFCHEMKKRMYFKICSLFTVVEKGNRATTTRLKRGACESLAELLVHESADK